MLTLWPVPKQAEALMVAQEALAVLLISIRNRILTNFIFVPLPGPSGC
jgi:hypothetical protein